jgi:hypothetical protein
MWEKIENVSTIFILVFDHCSVENTDPGPGAFLTARSGSGMEKNPEQGSAMNIPDLIFENFISVFWDKNN